MRQVAVSFDKSCLSPHAKKEESASKLKSEAVVVVDSETLHVQKVNSKSVETLPNFTVTDFGQKGDEREDAKGPVFWERFSDLNNTDEIENSDDGDDNYSDDFGFLTDIKEEAKEKKSGPASTISMQSKPQVPSLPLAGVQHELQSSNLAEQVAIF